MLLEPLLNSNPARERILFGIRAYADKIGLLDRQVPLGKVV